MTIKVAYPYIIIPITVANGHGGMKSVGTRHVDFHMRPNELSALDEAEARLDGRSRLGNVVYKAVYYVAPEIPKVVTTDIEIEEIDP